MPKLCLSLATVVVVVCWLQLWTVVNAVNTNQPKLKERQAIHDRWANQPLKKTTFDYIVVGAGTTGCAVACRLSQNGNQVLLIEAGGAQSALYHDLPGAYSYNLQQNKDQLWLYKTEPVAEMGNRVLDENHGKVIGGDSTVNAMVSGRGAPNYYDAIEKLTGARGWSFKELLPYFLKWENNTDPSVSSKDHGRTGPIRLAVPKSVAPILNKYVDALKSIGVPNVDHIPAPGPVANIGSGLFADGLRSSSSNGYIEFGGLCPELSIQANAHASKLIIDKEGSTIQAHGVEFVKNGTKHTVSATKEIIVSSGGYGSSQLLMLSGIGPRDHLTEMKINPIWVDLPVGSAYQNRPAINLLYDIKDQVNARPIPMLDDQQLGDCLTGEKGSLCEAPRLFITLNSKVNTPKEYTDIVYFGNVRPTGKGDIIQGSAFAFITRTMSQGHIRLRSADYRDLVRVQPNYFKHPEDKVRLMDAIAQFYRLVEETSFNKYASVPAQPQSPDCSYCESGPVWKCTKYHECLIQTQGITEFHPLGVMPIGAVDSKESVLDERLRVKGVSKLRVADTSILPSKDTYTPNTCPGSVAYMVAEKAAEMILEDNK
ncbi:L-sorbose 1-dehydrogenase-like [Oppia nitens]|uniref:L-sorbose 1-dehydrogenase-like n=1 Tax=Oppia nitens TaxID=1686743 RepID=UPI0023DCCF4E|nr:L-sorbose 1-dehydrogenase-like [Oppia nitens]